MAKFSDSHDRMAQWAALDRYLAGESPAGERTAVDRWIATDTEAARLARVLKQPIDPVTLPSVDVFTRRVLGAVDVAEDAYTLKRMPSLGRQTVRYSAWVTGTAVAFLVAGAMIAGRGRIMSGSREIERPLVYTSSAGQQGLITLPDGSSIRLNVASRLEVPADYARGNHVIRLQGEARIVATHDARNPLSVISAGTAIKVLGTTFFVRRYSTDTVTTVAVRDGKVAVGATVVSAGRALSINDRGATRLRMIDSSDFSFESGVLRLSQAPLVDVISALNRWYGADIQIADPSLRTTSFGGDFPLGSISDLELYLKPLDAHVERNGVVLTLSRRVP